LAHELSIGWLHDEMKLNGIPFKPRYISSGEEGKNACTYTCLVISTKAWCPPLHIIKLSNDKIIATKQKQSTTPYTNQNKKCNEKIYDVKIDNIMNFEVA
jgi:hypothetical protein